MLLPLEHTPTPAPGYQRSDVGRWQCESQLAFDRLTLYAPGWFLHGLAVGGTLLMFPWEYGAHVSPAAPLTFKINGGPGARIDVELTQPPDVQSPRAPYIIVRPRPIKPFVAPFAKPRRRRGVRLVWVKGE